MMPRRDFPRSTLSAPDPRHTRREWRAYVDLVIERATDAINGVAHSREAVFGLTRHVIQTGKTPFPVGDAAPKALAASLQPLCETFLVATVPDRRVRLARAVLAVARELDGLLTEEATAAAQASWGRQFKDD